MVHALKKVHGLLVPGGLLINVHDRPRPPWIDVKEKGRAIRVGRILDNSDFHLLRRTDAALVQVETSGRYVVEKRIVFEYNTRIDDFDSFDGWLADTWESMYITPEDRARLDAAMANAGEGAEVVIRWRARMSRLRAIKGQ